MNGDIRDAGVIVSMCCVLTFERADQLVSIFNQLFDEAVCSIQLDLVTFESLSEVRTVHKRVTEL